MLDEDRMGTQHPPYQEPQPGERDRYQSHPGIYTALKVSMRFIATGAMPAETLRGVVHLYYRPKRGYREIHISIERYDGGMLRPATIERISRYDGRQTMITFTERPDLPELRCILTRVAPMFGGVLHFTIVDEFTNPPDVQAMLADAHRRRWEDFTFPAIQDRNPEARVTFHPGIQGGDDLNPDYKRTLPKPPKYAPRWTLFLATIAQYYLAKAESKIVRYILGDKPDLVRKHTELQGEARVDANFHEAYFEATLLGVREGFMPEKERKQLDDKYQDIRMGLATEMQEYFAVYEVDMWHPIAEVLEMDAGNAREGVLQLCWFRNAGVTFLFRDWKATDLFEFGRVSCLYMFEAWAEIARQVTASTGITYSAEKCFWVHCSDIHDAPQPPVRVNPGLKAAILAVSPAIFSATWAKISKRMIAGKMNAGGERKYKISEVEDPLELYGLHLHMTEHSIRFLNEAHAKFNESRDAKAKQRVKERIRDDPPLASQPAPGPALVRRGM